MHKYRCSSCGYIYEDAPAFEDLPDSWVCPICSACKDNFAKVQIIEITSYNKTGTDIVDNEQSDEIKQKINILEEIKNINQQIVDPKHNVYQKTKYWNQQESLNILQTEALVSHIIEHLIKIEEKLDSIENKL